jgi:hypothetical protein
MAQDTVALGAVPVDKGEDEPDFSVLPFSIRTDIV